MRAAAIIFYYPDIDPGDLPDILECLKEDYGYDPSSYQIMVATGDVAERIGESCVTEGEWKPNDVAT